jgi:hypothetical protein
MHEQIGIGILGRVNGCRYVALVSWAGHSDLTQASVGKCPLKKLSVLCLVNEAQA